MKKLLLILLAATMATLVACEDKPSKTEPIDTIVPEAFELTGTRWGYYEEENLSGFTIKLDYKLYFSTESRGRLEQHFEAVGYPEYNSSQSAQFDYHFDGEEGELLIEGNPAVPFVYNTNDNTLVLRYIYPDNGQVVDMTFSQE